MDVCIYGCLYLWDIWIYGYMDLRIYGIMDIWIYGFMNDMRIYKFIDIIWIYGFTDL